VKLVFVGCSTTSGLYPILSLISAVLAALDFSAGRTEGGEDDFFSSSRSFLRSSHSATSWNTNGI